VLVTVGKLTRRLPKGLIKRSYQLPENANCTAKNAMTKQVWSNALSGKYPDHYIDLSLVKFSNPLRPTEKLRNAKLAIVDDELQVSWELNPLPNKTTRFDDEVYVVCFDIEEENSGHHYCFWLFVLSADGKRVSETQFLNTITFP
jgi:hypothetical protein